MKTLLVATLALALAAASASAAMQSFDFKDPKGVNNATFKTDAPLESITGSANGVSGTVKFDPANPTTLTGKIVVAAKTLQVGNPMMLSHLHGDGWLNVAKHPEITFEVVSLKNAKTADNVTSAEVTGKFSLKGVTKELTVPVKLTYLKDKLKARGGNQEGDLLVIRCDFTIKRSDYAIQPGQNEDKVSNDIALSLSIAGASPKQ
jgi:polyisoprenoid-binding protein YceI